MSATKDHFYVTLFSNGAQDLYPSNTLATYTARLAHPIDLGSADRWEVGLCEFSCHPPAVGAYAGIAIGRPKVALLYCDLITPQYVGAQYARCLRSFMYPTAYCNTVLDNVYYMPVERRSFQDIRIEIRMSTGLPAEFVDSDVPTKVVLHFRRVSAW